LQYHGNTEWSNNLERSVEVIVLRQCDEILEAPVSHRPGSGEGVVPTLL
jgi:hypothetical protein